MFATLGPVVFEVSADRVRTWSEARRTRGARWAQHQVHLAKPVQEFAGPELQSQTLSVRFDSSHGVEPKTELDQLGALCESGEVLPFVVGGEPIGDFILKSVSESWSRVDATGRITIATAELTLEEYA